MIIKDITRKCLFHDAQLAMANIFLFSLIIYLMSEEGLRNSLPVVSSRY